MVSDSFQLPSSLRDVVWSVGQVRTNPRPPLSQLSPRSVATSPLFPELGEQQERESGMGDGLDGVDKLAGDGGYSKTVQHAKEIFPFLGISCGGNEKKLLDLLTVLDKEHRHEVLASPSKPKGRRELKNLECSINFDGRGDYSSRGKGKRVVLAR
jgi:hypothetical protein